MTLATIDFSSRSAGFAIAVIGVCAAGPDAACLRAMEEAGGSTTVIGVWRYIILFLCNFCLGAVFEGGPRKLLTNAWQSRYHVLGASLIIVVINAGFTISLLKVDPALALLLISLSPLWAALLGWLLLGDTLPTRTLVAQALSLIATLVVFMPAFSALFADELSSEASEAETGLQDLAWDPIELVPLGTGFAVAALLTYSRWLADTCLEAAPAIGALLTAIAACTMMLAVQLEPASNLVDGLEPTFWMALLLSAAGCAIYDSALVIAPRSLTSAEVALILLAETIIGPLFIWILYNDAPDTWTLVGGALLLLTLTGHELSGMHASAFHPGTPRGLGSRPSRSVSVNASPLMDADGAKPFMFFPSSPTDVVDASARGYAPPLPVSVRIAPG